MTTVAPDVMLQSWTTSPELDELAPALVAALGELEDVARARTANAGTYSYRYADLGDVLAAARPVFARHALAISQVPVVDTLTVEITTTIWHSSGQWLKAAPLRLPAGSTAQQTGSAITYARRYSIMALLGLATEDDDGASAAPRQPVAPSLMSQSNLDRFRTAAADAGLSPEDVAAVVEEATEGRTDDVEQVWASEVPELRAALLRATTPHEGTGETGDGREQASRPSPAGEQRGLDVRSPAGEQLGFEETGDQ
jgi:ERF superfamily